MLNEEKIRLMTDIAMFEKKNEKDMILAGRYFKSDYISMWLLRSLLSYTAAFGLCLALWLLYQIEGIMSTMDLDAILRSAGLIGILYGTGLLLYLIFTYGYCAGKYEEASGNFKIYQAKLRHLQKKYDMPAGQDESREVR